VGLYIFAVGR